MKNKILVVCLCTILLTIGLSINAPIATSSEANIPSDNTATQAEEIDDLRKEKVDVLKAAKEKEIAEEKAEAERKRLAEEKAKAEAKNRAAAAKPKKKQESNVSTPSKGNFRGVPSVSVDFKSYTAYTCLSRKSAQWKKIQTIAYSDGNGLRKVGNYYCVAMGSYYSTTLGDLFRITTANGNTFCVILCDFKANAHTNSTHQYTARNQCITEFYVDYSCFKSAARSAGSISVIPGFGGKITSIEYLGNYFVD